ncbi:MAG TPA: DUF4129 domain-containing protein [Bryobacteraceae bacterium]|nr:DUF4129 domain-containing protein [Bryobacteraceae bacterium]
MAEPVARDGAIPAMEDAVRLLRQAPLATLVCHWVGSAPFALVVMWFWNDLTNPRTLDSTGALESFVLALLLVWMNCWRAVFAGRLRRQLGETTALASSAGGLAAGPARWTARRIWRLVAVQSFFGATKLVIMPLAWLTMFPLASTVAFYRNLAALSGGEDLDPLQLMAKARKLAVVEAGQSWALLPLFAFLHLLITVNLAIVLALLPRLVRMLTGYESAFSRSGSYFAFNPLFFLLVVAVSWIAFDPFVQAVYCVRCFRGESLETGEDLLAGLRRIRAGVAAAAVALAFLAMATRSSAAVPPGDLERSVQQTMQSHEYDWRLPPAASSPAKTSWLVRLADHMVAGMRAVSDAVGNTIRRLLNWLSGNRAVLPLGGAPPSSGLHWSLYALTGVVVLAAMALLWRRWQARKGRPAPALGSLTGAIRLDAEDLTPDRLPEERWLELADECLREENFRLALRALYLANLAWLGWCEFLTIDAGKTNREYELELKRRARAFPEARGLFTGNVAAFERAWYGLHEVSREDVGEFRGRVDRMKAILPASHKAAA